MKNQQQAEREEQQRIKNLVLNYDLRENEEQEGDYTMSPPLPEINNVHTTIKAGHEKMTTYHLNRSEKQGKERGAQRVRRLQMNDLDWYGSSPQERSDRDASDVESSTHVGPSDENQPVGRTGRQRSRNKRQVKQLDSQTRRAHQAHRSRPPR
jgi:regulator of nonsense transcripts 2